MTKKTLALLKSHFHKQGGLEKSSWRIAHAFAKKDFLVHILTSGKPKISPPPLHPIEELQKISFSYLKVPRWPGFLRIQKFDQACEKWLSSHDFPIILGLDRNRFQTHLRVGNGVHKAYLEQRKKAECPLKNFTFSVNPFHQTILEIEREAFESPHLKKIITNSYKVRKEILSYYSVDPKKIVTLHNGVEWSEMEADFSLWEEKKPWIIERWGLSPYSFHFLFIGHGYHRKGLEILLKALSHLKSRDFHLTVLGKDSNLCHYLTLTQKLGLEKKVRFLGPRTDVRNFYQLADAIVISSFYDPFANVTVEALAMGVFVISSSANGGSEVLIKDSGCIVADPFQVDEWVEALYSAMNFPKTKEHSFFIRNSIRHLDFPIQLELFVNSILS